MKIISIVEGHGDQHALPLLLRRIVLNLGLPTQVEIPKPIRVSRSKILKEGELERAVELAALQLDEAGGILILLDADDDCPAALGKVLITRARLARSDKRIEVTLAKSEYESWFLASICSLAGARDLLPGIPPPPSPEDIRDAKGWLTRNSHPGRPYKETLDQPAFSELMDLDAARGCASFRKLCRCVTRLLS
jgi:hypothetical protein